MNIANVSFSDPPYFTVRPALLYQKQVDESVVMVCAASGTPSPFIEWKKVRILLLQYCFVSVTSVSLISVLVDYVISGNPSLCLAWRKLRFKKKIFLCVHQFKCTLCLDGLCNH